MFPLQVAVNRLRKRRVGQPVCAGGAFWQQCPGHFVFALRTAFKTVVTVRNAPRNGLVVAGFKVQAVHPLHRTPVTAKRNEWEILIAFYPVCARPISTDSYQTGCDGLAIGLVRHKHHPVCRLGLGQLMEEAARQVGRVAVFQIGALVAGVEKIPVGWCDFLSGQRSEPDASLGHFAPFLLDFLALLLGQAGQKIIHVGVEPECMAGRAVVPVKLHRVPEHEPGRLRSREILPVGKQNVQR